MAGVSSVSRTRTLTVVRRRSAGRGSSVSPREPRVVGVGVMNPHSVGQPPDAKLRRVVVDGSMGAVATRYGRPVRTSCDVHVINLQANWYVSLPACSRPLAPLGSAALHGHLQLGSAGHGLRTAAGVS